MTLKEIKDIADSNEYVEGTGSDYAYNGFIEGFLVAMHLFKPECSCCISEEINDGELKIRIVQCDICKIKTDTEFDELMDKLNK